MSPEPVGVDTGAALPLAWSRSFPAVPAQIREARRFLTRILAGWLAGRR